MSIAALLTTIFLAIKKSRFYDLRTFCPILFCRQNGSHIVFLSPKQDSKLEGEVKVLLDGNSVSTEVAFRYLEDPVIASVEPLDVFVT